MLFRVDPTSGVGLAEQIAAGVRAALGDGTLAPGARLPAAREVAAGLDVNMHTVLRAYQQLRDEGLLELRRGRGAVIRDDVDPAGLTLEPQVRALVAAARRLGVTPDDVLGSVRSALERG